MTVSNLMDRGSLLKVALLIIILFLGTFTKAQNLVPNPDFEEYKNLLCNFLELSYPQTEWKARFDSILSNWRMPTNGTVDVYSSYLNPNCELFPTKDGRSPSPYSGHTMTRIFTNLQTGTNYREYLQIKLNNPLIKGQQYLAGFYLASGTGNYATNNQGMNFSKKEIGSEGIGPLNESPQINNPEIENENFIWKRISGCFLASGEEEYLTIGNFYNDANTKIAKVNMGGFNGSTYFIDSVFVEAIPEPFIPNVITPNGDCCNEKLRIESIHFGWWTLEVFNRWGERVYISNDYRNTWDGGGLNTGVYYYLLQHKCADIKYKGNISIIH